MEKNALEKLKIEKRQDPEWIFGMLRNGYDKLKLKVSNTTKEFENVQADIPLKFDFRKGNPKCIRFYWSDIRRAN